MRAHGCQPSASTTPPMTTGAHPAYAIADLIRRVCPLAESVIRHAFSPIASDAMSLVTVRRVAVLSALAESINACQGGHVGVPRDGCDLICKARQIDFPNEPFTLTKRHEEI